MTLSLSSQDGALNLEAKSQAVALTLLLSRRCRGLADLVLFRRSGLLECDGRGFVVLGGQPGSK